MQECTAVMFLLLTESKFTPAHVKKACMGRGGTAPRFLRLGSGGRWSQLHVLAALLPRELGGTQSLSGRFGEDRNLSSGTQTLHRPSHRQARTLRLLHKCTEVGSGRNVTVLKKRTEGDGMRRLIPSCWTAECPYRSNKTRSPPVIWLRPLTDRTPVTESVPLRCRRLLWHVTFSVTS